MSIPFAICSHCGNVFYGWALRHQPKRGCPECGAPMFLAVDPGTKFIDRPSPAAEGKLRRSDAPDKKNARLDDMPSEDQC